MNQTPQKKINNNKKILILQYRGDRCGKKGYRKGILHLISIQIFLCLLLMMILELLGRQWIYSMENSRKKTWLNKWKPCIRMRLGI
jgi:hypothetical protein